LSAGNNQQGYDQGQLDADRSQYDYLTGYNYNLGKDYGSFLAAPGVKGNYQMNAVSPGAATIGGAMSGFGFGNQLANAGAYIPGNSSFFNPMFGGGPGLGGFV
jgi:hypothetical protein